MGITLALLDEMRSRGLLQRAGQRVLDVGSSNLYQAEAPAIQRFVRAFRDEPMTAEFDRFAERLSRGAAYDFVKGGINESFVGELLERCGFDYLALDIANGYRTEIFDLNRQDLPRRHREAFDVVLNIGTTEHVLNQYNSFKVIHEAAKPGGVMIHQLPVSGFTDHGYFVYTARMLFDLATYNHYEIAALWHEGPAGEDDVFAWTKPFAAVTAPLGPLGLPGPTKVPNIVLTVAFRRRGRAPFQGALEVSTSVGEVPMSVRAAYASSLLEKANVRARAAIRAHPRLAAALRRVLRRNP
jgi:SAM-dependent methyltransferase